MCVLALGVLALTTGCDGHIGVRGRVLGADGKPIEGAQLSLGAPGESLGFEGTTDANGCFELGSMVSPGQRDYFLAVSSDGHRPFEGAYRSAGEYAVLVRLAPEGSEAESAAELLSEWSAPELESCASNDMMARPSETKRLPAFEDFPASDPFTGEPARVNLESHPDGKTFRTALTHDAEVGAVDAQFAGHYRIVVIGCGTSCRTVWAVDLVDGSLHNPFTASTGVTFRPDSRLIVENDPAYYESLLDEMTATEVEQQMDLYGPPRFFVENDGEFEQIGPPDFRIDRETGKVVPGAREHAGHSWQCTNDLELRCAEGACEAETGDAFTPMSVHVDDSGGMSVCAYSGCWEGIGEVVENGEFLVLIGHDLEFSTSRDALSQREDIVIAIDRSDGVGTLKVAEFAQPLLCERL